MNRSVKDSSVDHASGHQPCTRADGCAAPHLPGRRSDRGTCKSAQRGADSGGTNGRLIRRLTRGSVADRLLRLGLTVRVVGPECPIAYSFSRYSCDGRDRRSGRCTSRKREATDKRN